MNKSISVGIGFGLTALLMVAVFPAMAASVEQRLDRLERMTENPVLLQLSRRLGEQQREIQELQDAMDRLKRDLRNAEYKANKRYKETDDRLSFLEGNSPRPNAKYSASEGVVIAPNSLQEPTVETKLSVPSTVRDPDAQNAPIDVKLETKQIDSQAIDNKPSTPPYVSVKPSTQVKTAAAVTSPAVLEKGDAPIETTVAKVATTPIKIRPATEQEKSAYQQAFALMKASKYDAAIQEFEQFLERYPQSDLASNSAYWAGEGYLIKRRYQTALDAFTLIIDRYSESPKMSDAQLRAGDCLAQLKRPEEARKMYQAVINSRPHSRAAKSATKRLRSLQ